MKSETLPKNAKRLAIELIIMFGVVSLVGDVMYEGARSINGPYLKTLGASAAIVGLVAGIGELLGYAIRLVSGYFADKTRAYWIFTFVGYGLLITVPLLSLAGVWQMAALFIVLERFGKAVRAPAKDTILSSATKQVGTGFGFGLHEAMDQAGALLGPLVFTAVFAFGGRGSDLASYKEGYAWMWIPFAILIVSVIVAFIRVPDPGKLERALPAKPKEEKRLSRTFWLYTLFTFATTLGFVAWPILSFHYAATGVLSGAEIALFYAVAMGVDGLVALAIGVVYDRMKKGSGTDTGGLRTLLIIPLFSLAIPLLGFGSTKAVAVAAAVMWGVVMGTHETIMKSAIADITPMRKRGTGYGVFNTAYGVAVFVSSALMGVLYDWSITAVIVLAVAAEVLAIPLYFVMRREALGGRKPAA
jgi:MFS family permease